MDKESKSISNLIKTKRYLIHTISLIIPYTAGIIFIDAFSNYYHIRKCETFDESSLSLCLIINTQYISMVNMAGVIFVISAIVLMILKKLILNNLKIFLENIIIKILLLFTQ